MAALSVKRRRPEGDVRRPKKKIRVKRQTEYHSSSEDDDEADDIAKPTSAPSRTESNPKSILKHKAPAAVENVADDDIDVEELENVDDLDELGRNTALNAAQVGNDSDEDKDAEDNELLNEDGDADDLGSEDNEDIEEDSESETASMTSSNAARAKKKRNDPDAFATSISKILDTKLTSAKRQDPVLSRSKSAADANKSLSDAKLEHKARAQIRAEKQQALEKGRVKDVLGLQTADVDTGAILEEEKRLKKTAQRGVVKLFNAVRAAQVKAEEGMRQARSEGIVGMQKREEKVNEMSKQGFLDLISSGGQSAVAG